MNQFFQRLHLSAADISPGRHTVHLGMQFVSLHICLDYFRTPRVGDGEVNCFRHFVNVIGFL